jgi:hypothetical protein
MCYSKKAYFLATARTETFSRDCTTNRTILFEGNYFNHMTILKSQLQIICRI